MGKEKNQDTNTITEYDALYAARTGLTLLIEKQPIFDEGHVTFKPADNGRDALLTTPLGTVTIVNLNPEHLKNSASRGFIMFYETEDGEVVRNTTAHYIS